MEDIKSEMNIVFCSKI